MSGNSLTSTISASVYEYLNYGFRNVRRDIYSAFLRSLCYIVDCLYINCLLYISSSMKSINISVNETSITYA